MLQLTLCLSVMIASLLIALAAAAVEKRYR